MTERRFALVLSIGLIAGLTLMPVAADAAQQTAEPAMLNMSWWWEDYQGEEIDVQGNKVIVETPSPFCPSTPGSTGAVPGACAEGRIPIEIRGGDYESPVMLSAVGFDLSYLTPGSEVSKFTVTFLEAEAGCYDGPDEDEECTPNNPPGNGDHVEQTGPINADGHKLQACLLPEIIGDAEARPYTEVPRYTCTDADPVAERKEVPAILEDKNDATEDPDGVDHVWTFDLTPFAQEWAKAYSVSTAIMITGEKPADSGPQDSWRVVLAGAKVFKGVRTKLVYEPSELSVNPPPTDGTTDPTTTVGGTTTGGTTGGFGLPSSGGTTTGGTVPGGTAPSPGASPSAPPGTELAGDALEQQGMPGYVMLALLAGLIGFVMVRQVVIESTTGIRPDGVLAKIHALNAERRGVEADDTVAVGALGGALSSIGRAVATPFKKLPFFRKG
jgi:hypothetical protein